MIGAATLERGVGARRKDRTRRLICTAANELFIRYGFAVPTMEEIAQAAGVRRSTLYNHFRDKGAILQTIADEYVEAVRAVISELPGPVPTARQTQTWLESFRDLVIAQPAPAELIVSAGYSPDAIGIVSRFGQAIQDALAERSEAFARALRPGEAFRRAWADSTLGELGAALTQVARFGDTPATRYRLEVAAMLFTRFVQDDR
jgi:AcrR family transcriptional regulator